MRTDWLHSQHGGGNGNGSTSQAESTGDGAGGTERGRKRNVDIAPWFEEVEPGCGPSDQPMVECKDGFCPMPQPKVDMVNRPPHYANPDKKIETIDKIEDAVQFAPNAVIGGLHWQTLKYLDRLWLKGNPLEDAKKARWYLERMIKKLED